VQFAVANKLVFSKIQARFGGELRLCVSGGAPLAKEVQEFFLACGIIILEGYGLTESGTAATLNHPRSFRVGSVGTALPKTELKIDDDGEILIRGPQVFQGYWKDDAATKAVLTEDGWLRSGDIGTIDRDGFLRITDRKKDIIVTAGGKNVAPQNIENALKSTQYVSQALVIGDRKPFLTALITLDPQEIEAFATAKGLPTDLVKLVGTDDVLELVHDAVDKTNGEVGRVEQVKKWRVLPLDFTQETGELTPTLKLKRKVVCERYGRWIEEMYADGAADEGAVTDTAILDQQRDPVTA
jgi:long-chain acyl-CoA synthetase